MTDASTAHTTEASQRVAAFELMNVSFTYQTAYDQPNAALHSAALKQVSLHITQGEFLGIIGPSGAGKTTLAHCLSGAIPHHFAGKLRGSIKVLGTESSKQSLSDIAFEVGSVLQDIDAQMVALNVLDEMLFGLENFGVAHDQIMARLDAALNTVGMLEYKNREIATLSGGQKQKIAIAAMLALQPHVLVLDEPTAALDPATSETVFQVLQHINQTEHITIVIIEQKVSLLARFCNRVCVMDQGRLVLDGTPHEVFSQTEQLRTLGVDSPRVTRVYNSLAKRHILSVQKPCLEVAELVETMKTELCERIATTSDAFSDCMQDKTRSMSRAKPVVCTAARAAKPIAVRTAEPIAARAAEPIARVIEPIVCIHDISFHYPATQDGISHVSLELYPKEVLAVVGQNGAGKSTLTKLINGLLKPDEGFVSIAGLDTKNTSPSVLAAHCSTLFQNPDRQICKNTVLDEVAFSLELQGVSSQKAREQALPVIQSFNLNPDDVPFTLSRGQRQKVALASVVVTHPELIILDEPTSGLDYRECMTTMQTVRKLAEQGSAVLMVCHDMEVVSDFADRIAVMTSGALVTTGTQEEVFSKNTLLEQAHIEAPQIMQLSEALMKRINPAYKGLREVSEVVDLTQHLFAKTS